MQNLGSCPERHRLSLKKRQLGNQFNLQMERICTAYNWKRINMEHHDFWYLLSFFCSWSKFLLSPEKKGLWTKIEITENNIVLCKISVFDFEKFVLRSHPSIHLSTHTQHQPTNLCCARFTRYSVALELRMRWCTEQTEVWGGDRLL